MLTVLLVIVCGLLSICVFGLVQISNQIQGLHIDFRRVHDLKRREELEDLAD